jgi:hypothetical protein
MDNKTNKALTFLCDRNPFDSLQRSQWVILLNDYLDKQGHRALQALAGFYCFCIDNKQGDEQSHAIRSTFTHDLNGMNESSMLPRSSSYAEIWDQECVKRGWL